MKTVSNYSFFSSIYNEHMRGINYKKWADYIYLITKKYLPRNASVLEIAAGNCRIATHIKYKNIVASDLSLQMLRCGNSHLAKVCCNMESLPFKKKFDLVFSAFDSVNYLLSKKNLIRFFTEVKNILDDDGLLTFDVSMKNNSSSIIGKVAKNHSVNGISYTHTQWFDDSKWLHHNQFVFHSPNGEQITELHTQKIYPFELFFTLPASAGFYVVDCLNAFTTQEGNENSKRLQFIYKAA